MLRRDLSVVFRARATWILAALSALMVGHGFVQSLDQAGVAPASSGLAPMWRGLYLALCVFGPLLGSRALSLEKERRTFHTLLLQTGSASNVIVSKWLAGFCGVLLPWLAVLSLVGIWLAVIGPLGAQDVGTLLGYAIYSGYVACVGVAAASLTPTFFGAAFLGLFTIAWNSAIDASDTVPALAWLQGNLIWSPGTYLQRFEAGKLELGATCWLLTAGSTGIPFSWCGCRFDIRGGRRWLFFLAATLIWGSACMLAREAPGAYSLSEPAPAAAGAPSSLQRDARLSPGARSGLAALSYAGFPCAFLVLGFGWFATKRRAG